jgi:DNA-binding transcriptional MerR regulator
MSEENAATEAAEVVSAPETPTVEAPEAKAERPSKSEGSSVRDSLERAQKQIEAREKAEAPKPDVTDKTDATPSEQPRAPDGKFAPKDPTAVVEAPVAPESPEDAPPAWMHDQAKAAFKDLPKPLRAELTRRTTELEKGFGELQQRYAPLKEYDEMAQRAGTTLNDALRNYTGIERELRTNPLNGLDRICRNLGLDLRQVAAHIMQQPEKTPQEKQYQAQLEAREAEKAQIAQQTSQLAEQLVSQFWQFNPGAEPYGDMIAYLLNTGKASGLQDAYEKARAMVPTPPVAQTHTPPAAQTRDTTPAPQTSTLSLDGNPGSNPAAQSAPSKTNREALEKAARRVSLSL